MENKNSKSESYIVKEAESIIENYLNQREIRDINKYHKLKEKYERLKMLSVAVFVTTAIGMLISVIIGQ